MLVTTHSQIGAPRSTPVSLILKLLIVGGIWIHTSSSAWAQVVLERLFPPAVSCGGEATVQAEGKFPQWPPQVYCDRSDISVVPLEESGQLLVHTSPQTMPGVAWIRFHDPHGVSAAVPLCLTTQAITAETEPNASFAESMSVSLPTLTCGRLNPNNDVDCFRVRLVSGQRFTATLTAHRVLRSPMDAVMQIVDKDGHVLCQSDDALGIDPQVSLQSTTDQEVIVRLFAFPETPNSTIGFAGGTAYIYLLSLHSEFGTDHFLPLLDTEQPTGYAAFSRFGPNIAFAEQIQIQPATEISPKQVFEQDSGSWQWLPQKFVGQSYFENQLLDPSVLPVPPCMFSGHVSEPGEVDQFTFEAEQDVTYEILVHSQQYGFPLDSTLRLNDKAGVELGSNDDLARRPYDAGMNFKASESGPVTVSITDLSGDGSWLHAYSLSIEKLGPAVQLAVDRDAFTSSPGQVLEIPVSVVRQNGFDTQLTIRALGLPDGVVMEPAISEKQGESSKTVKLQIKLATEAERGNFRFRIEATSDALPESSISCLFSPHLGMQVSDFWLTLQE